MTAFWLDTLAAFIADFRLESLKPATIEQTSYVMLDTIGAIAGGAAEPEMQALTAKLAVSPAGEASVIGTDKKAVSAAAAFLNGTAGTFLEMDEGNRFAKGHPAIHALPAVWAHGRDQGPLGQGRDGSLILGYEIGARIGIAASLRPDMHPHGTWGTVGAAAAVAKLLGYDAAQIRETINVASSLTFASSKRTMLEGGTVRNAYAGISNRMALMAIDLDRGGVRRRTRRAVERVRQGRVGALRHGEDDRRARPRLADRPQLFQAPFLLPLQSRRPGRTSTSCSRREAGQRPTPSSAIDVASYLYAAELDDQAPRNTLGAKFSVPFAVATRLVRGSSAVENFTWDAVARRAGAGARQAGLRGRGQGDDRPAAAAPAGACRSQAARRPHALRPPSRPIAATTRIPIRATSSPAKYFSLTARDVVARELPTRYGRRFWPSTVRATCALSCNPEFGIAIAPRQSLS